MVGFPFPAGEQGRDTVSATNIEVLPAAVSWDSRIFWGEITLHVANALVTEACTLTTAKDIGTYLDH